MAVVKRKLGNKISYNERSHCGFFCLIIACLTAEMNEARGTSNPGRAPNLYSHTSLLKAAMSNFCTPNEIAKVCVGGGFAVACLGVLVVYTGFKKKKKNSFQVSMIFWSLDLPKCQFRACQKYKSDSLSTIAQEVLHLTCV